MTYGVIIETIDGAHRRYTQAQWGLILLNDLSVGPATPRTKFVQVPEMDGALDLSESLTGRVSYNQRTISFTLFSPLGELDFEVARMDLSEFANGKRMRLYLPDDDRFYFAGRMSIGGKSGYHNGRIPVTMTADPYRYKKEITKGWYPNGTWELNTGAMPTIPTFTASEGGATVKVGSVSHTLSAGANTFSDIVFNGHVNLEVNGASESVMLTYQEGQL